MALISVIVPVYNVEPYIHRCIDSILNQTFTDFDLILVDDGSTDKSGSICDEYATKDKRIITFHQKNQGQSAARNYAINYVINNLKSSFISFIDSDDWVSIDYLSVLYYTLIESDSEISCCDYIRVNSIFDAIYQSPKGLNTIVSTPNDIWIHQLKCESYVVCKLFPVHYFDNLHFEQNRIFEDTALTVKLLFKANKITYVPLKDYYYFNTPNSTTTNKWTEKKLDAIWAHKQQLRFLKKNKYYDSYHIVKSQYISCLAQSANNIKKYECKKKYLYSYYLRFVIFFYFLFLKKYLISSKYKLCYYSRTISPYFHRFLKHFNLI